MTALLYYLFAVALVGLPAGAGAFFVARDVRRADIAPGILLLIYAGALVATFGYFLPEGKIAKIAFQIKLPAVFAICSLIGIVLGIRARRDEPDQ